MTRSFDESMLTAINALAGKSSHFDHVMSFLAQSHTLRGLVFVSILWWYWFRGGDAALVRQTRSHVICTLAGGVAAIVMARILALFLPFRVRPRFDPKGYFQTPATWPSSDLIHWSSFPSDHAVLFSAFAVGIGLISRRAGLLAFTYFLLFIGFPRIYLGFHYPSDVLAGAVLGAVIGYAFNSRVIREPLSGLTTRFEQSRPALFYLTFFVACDQIATMFDDLRQAASILGRVVRQLA